VRRALAIRAWLAAPAPTWAFWVVGAAGLACFALALAAFAFPLSYCDSPSWAPGYLGRLVGEPLLASAKQRGFLVPAWFQLWGGLSLARGLPNLIGVAQATLLIASGAAVLWRVRRGATRAELLVLPSFVLSALRHAIYSQALMSESLVIALGVAVALVIVRDDVLPLWQCAVAALLAGLAASARVEALLLFPLLLGRIATDRAPAGARARAFGLALTVGAAGFAGLAALAPPARGEPIGRVMILAEWMRYTAPPQGAAARRLHFGLVDRIERLTQGAHLRDIYDGLAPARALFQETPGPSGVDLGRLLAYQLANRPLTVLGDRLAALADLHASGYAAFWRGYHAWSVFYQPYDQMFAHWSPDDLVRARYSCPAFALAQAHHYKRTALRSESAVRGLRQLHALAEGYARWVLRALVWAALPLGALVLVRRRGGRSYAWLTALVFGSLALRAVFVCADERYQLPVDLLAVAWLMLTLRHALAPAGPPHCDTVPRLPARDGPGRRSLV
jgi:hypothetical protein